MYPYITKLKNENKAVAQVRTECGAPRLFLNGDEVYPLLAWSWGLVDSARIFRECGIDLLHPILGLNASWPESGRYDWSEFEALFEKLLAQNPDAYFLPRVLLDVPAWWKQQHPDELIVCALPTQPDNDRQYRDVIRSGEGGMLWGISMQEPSWASDIWRADMEKLLRAFLQFMENSPLASRLVGYQIGSGIYGEWHHYLSEFVPDLSEQMQRKIGAVPGLDARLQNQYGLLRDPEKEHDVIEHYRRFHEDVCAETLLHFARITKEETENRVLCGAFYGYQLENVWIQEGGHLAPEKILRSPHIDFLASPYSYQTTNIEGRQWWEHDVIDGAGNDLGRARGVAGDGGYRVLLESLKRHGKLYLPELDAGTYLEPPPINPDGTGGSDVERELCMVGGDGSTTVEGTMQILQRDLGRVFASGCGGWLFDFGPVMRTKKSWYADEPIIEQVQRFAELGKLRADMNLQSVARIAAVYDAQSLFATRHWRAEAPFEFGAYNLDYFTRWFMDSQVRALHRIGAPVDYLYRFDLNRSDAEKYGLLFMVNTFSMRKDEVTQLHELLRNSGTTVVWMYAPGFIAPDKLDLAQMQRLTGFEFEVRTEPGPMLVRADFDGEHGKIEQTFGVSDHRWPRFAVQDSDAENLGYWTDCDEVAFARKQMDGWQSVYVGTAPMPQPVLRWLAQQAGAMPWSSEPDIVVSVEDAAMLVATSDGARTLTLPKPIKMVETGRTRQQFDLNLKYGEVRIFVK